MDGELKKMTGQDNKFFIKNNDLISIYIFKFF